MTQVPVRRPCRTPRIPGIDTRGAWIPFAAGSDRCSEWISVAPAFVKRLGTLFLRQRSEHGEPGEQQRMLPDRRGL